MIRLAGADLVLPDRVVSGGMLIVAGERIVDVVPAAQVGAPGADVEFDVRDRYIVPGFIDVHVHGVEGSDTLDGGSAIADIAGKLPRYGVTAFCPTSIACDPAALRQMLAGVCAARTTRPPAGARVLPAHLESNFISEAYKGAQPASCLRIPRQDAPRRAAGAKAGGGDWGAADILDEIAAARPDVGIVTVAPEIDGVMELIRELVAHGHHVSLGHSGASYEQAVEAIYAGARRATHLFNRMTPITHRAPGLAGAVLESDDVVAELVCDGVHVHPAMMRVALAAKRPERIMAITDGTGGSGLPRGAQARLGGRPITVGDAAYLEDGTLAGSTLTMDRAFLTLTSPAVGLSLPEAATVCATTPARALALQGFGVLAPGAMADFVVLDRELRVVQTWIGGTLAYDRTSNGSV
jgi:N-acetylglucosamine-6-phosphate deacetylase